MKLRQQLILNWLIVSLMSILAVSAISIWITYQTLKEHSLSELNNISKTVRITANIAMDISVKNYLRAIAEKNLDVVQRFYQYYKTGQLTEAEAKARIEEIMLSQTIGKTGYNFIYNISQGPEKIICEVHPHVPGLDIAGYDFGQTAFALKNGYFEYQWKNPDESEQSKKAMYVKYFEPWQWLIAASSYKEEFKYLIDKTVLKQQFSTIKVGEKGYIFILDLQGNLVLHPIMENQNILHLTDTKGNRFVEKMIAQKNGLIYYHWKDATGSRYVNKVAILNYFPELGWIVGASTYASDILQPLKNLSYAIALVAVFILLLGIFVIILLINSLTKPLTQVTLSAQRLAEGETRECLAKNMLLRHDEVGDLARTFNVMVDKVTLREKHLKQAEQLVREYNMTLEDKVMERTEQLEQANTEIHLLNRRLQEDNLRLSAELHVTRRLQQMLLPNERELAKIEGVAITSFILPAEEVGGDYYDILPHAEGVKIGIGDVTGHGLDSSVIMLLLQACVRTLLTAGVQDSTQFLAILNRTVYDSVNRLKSDKSLTLVLLDYRYDGTLTLSGQHEEVLVVRSTGLIERIDTIDLGFFIGMEPDINQFLGSLELTLSPGDGIVLYTDGITEAFNKQKQQYSVERLCQVVGQHWQETVQSIKQAIIEDLSEHVGEEQLIDDVTLIILKRQ